LVYTWYKLLNKKIDYRDHKLYISIISITVICIFNYFVINKFIKIVLITIILGIFFRYLFKEKIQKCIITPIFNQLIIMISEAILAICFTLLKIDITLILTTSVINMISNLGIAIISLLIGSLKITRKIYNKILEITDKIKSSQLLMFSLIGLIIQNIILAMIYYKIIYIIVLNILFVIICFVIIFYSLKTQNKFNKVSNKYNIAINSLKDYEKMMNKYRVANHENKNLLLSVRAMIVNNEKNIPEYIDKIVENKYEDDEKLLFDMVVIPSGGLRATIYSEILKIQNKKIKYNLNIDKSLKTFTLLELDENIVLDICKVIGVFIDNAIEETENKKKSEINISLYVFDNKLNISISNTYNNKIDIDRIYDIGYSTKGNERGNGLALVKQIISSNNSLENRIEISEKVFTQILIIK